MLNLEKILVYILILAILAVAVFVAFVFFGKISKTIQVAYPAGGEELRVGGTYKIEWKAAGISKVGIVLFNGQTPKWVAKDIDASLGSYEWKVYPGQDYGDDFWLAVVEFPWQSDSKVAYTKGAFAIIYPEQSSCAGASIVNQWPYIPGDYPNIRRVFITKNTFAGNLGGLDGADKKCQDDASARGYTGVWHAFLGGDSDKETAVNRLNNTPRQLNGVFVEANPGIKLSSGINCYALLGNNFDKFKATFSNLTAVNKQKLSDDFFANFDN